MNEVTIVYRIYDWQAKVKYYYDFDCKIFFVDPQYEQEFLQRVRQEI